MTTPRHHRGYNDEDDTPSTTNTGPGTAQSSEPLHDDSSQIDSRLTGPGRGGGGLFDPAHQQVTGLQHPAGAPPQTDYTDTYHNINEGDYQRNAEWKDKVGDSWSFGGDISHNDLDRMHFGIAEPAVLKAAQDASTNGRQHLEQLASAINGGASDAVGTADDILRAGEPGLKFFDFFAPAYNAWRCGAVSCATLREQYHAECGMSFSAYASDSQTMADLSQQLVSIQQELDNAYNALVPTWQGDAAANFEAKMAVFFRAAATVTEDVGVAGKDVAALVHGLQKLVLAKAQTVAELYADVLPNGIDGVMAQSLVKVAQHLGDKRMNLTAFYLLGGTIDRQNWLEDFFNPFGDMILEAEAASMAPQMAADWCNNVLVPQFEGRENALQSVNTETKQRIQQGFAEFTKQMSSIKDPFAAMAAATAGTHPATPAGGGSGGGGSGGGSAGAPSVGGGGGGGVTAPTGVGSGGGGGVSMPSGGGSGGGGATPSASSGGGGGAPTSPASWTPPASPTYPSGGSGSGSSTSPHTSAPTVPTMPTTSQGTSPTTPTGGGTGSSAMPTMPTVPTMPTTPTGAGGTGSSTAPTMPTVPTGSTGANGVHDIDPKHDIHKNHDGSVSLNPDRGLTISPVHGKRHVFTLTDTDSDGVTHTYRVHFDKHGNPVVHEVVPKDLDGLDEITTPVAHTPEPHPGGGAGVGDGAAGGAGISAGGGVAGAGAAAAHHAHAASADLAPGAQVAGDDTMGTAGPPPQQTSPVAGSAGEAAGGHQGGFGGVPMMGGGMGRPSGGQEESERRFGEQGEDLVGEDELDEWQAMGPVIGEQ